MSGLRDFGTVRRGGRGDRATGRNGDMKYEIIMYWSGEDKVFVAEIPELPGCIAHGDSEEKVLKSVREAARLWVDVAKEFGDPVPQPKGKQLLLA